MESRSYTFDPCSLDESDQEDNVTLDSWRPTKKKISIVQSKWRAEQIGENHNQQPGLDELKKIKMHLNKESHDADIMNAFGITCETLVAIKKNKYSPVNGISLDNQSKIYVEFKKVDEKVSKLQRAIDYMAKVMFVDDIAILEYKNACRKPKENIIKSSFNYEDCDDYEEDEYLTPL